MHTQRKHALLDRARTLSGAIRSEGRSPTPAERAELDGLVTEAQVAYIGERLATEPGSGFDGSPGGGLAAAVIGAGFDRKTNASVVVPFDAPRFEATATFDGTFEDSNRRITVSPTLGADQRFLWPSLPITRLELGETGISSFRQKTRTLAAPADMIRDVDAVTQKPETSTTTEIITAPAKQIASIQTAVPNVVIDSQQFRAFLDFDVRLAWNEAVDYMVVDAIATSTPAWAAGGTNFVEDALYAAEAVRAAGYSPDLLVLSPGDSLAFALAQLTGGDSYIAPPSLGLRLVTVKNLEDDAGFVMDSRAAGQLFLSPAVFGVFEEAAGQTNSSTVRFESNGLYVIQREDAIAAVGSAAS